MIKILIITVDPSSILTESLLRELGYYQFMTSISILQFQIFVMFMVNFKISFIKKLHSSIL